MLNQFTLKITWKNDPSVRRTHPESTLNRLKWRHLWINSMKVLKKNNSDLFCFLVLLDQNGQIVLEGFHNICGVLVRFTKQWHDGGCRFSPQNLKREDQKESMVFIPHDINLPRQTTTANGISHGCHDNKSQKTKSNFWEQWLELSLKISPSQSESPIFIELGHALGHAS